MGSLQWALSWLMVGAVGLAPILAYWAAGLIGEAFRRKRGGRPTGSTAPGQEGEGADPSETAPPG
jgi:hypothetical protein